jgi:hypothetical protein
MNRQQMIEKASEAIRDNVRLLVLASGTTLEQYERQIPGIVRALAAQAVSAILPQVTTVEELEALRVGALLVGKHPDVSGQQIAIARGSDRYRYTNGRHEFSSARVAKESGPLTVVWQP